MKHENKVAIVTGATMGIGMAIAKRLCEEGATVVICSRKKENVDKAVEEFRDEGYSKVMGIVCHISNSQQRKNLVAKTMKEYGRIDILINNVGCNPAASCKLMDTSEEAFDKIIDINLKSGFMLTQEVYPHMKAGGGGSILFMSSACGLVPEAWPGIYAVSKTAILGLIKALSHELAPDNIRVNGIAAGIFKTKFGEAITAGNKQLKNLMLNRIGQKRFAEPEECAGVASFLCSNDASYMNGETLAVTGGLPTRL